MANVQAQIAPSTKAKEAVVAVAAASRQIMRCMILSFFIVSSWNLATGASAPVAACQVPLAGSLLEGGELQYRSAGSEPTESPTRGRDRQIAGRENDNRTAAVLTGR